MGVSPKNLPLSKTKLLEERCFRCNRLLFRGIVEEVEIKCSRCGTVQYIGTANVSVASVVSEWRQQENL